MTRRTSVTAFNSYVTATYCNAGEKRMVATKQSLGLLVEMLPTEHRYILSIGYKTADIRLCCEIVLEHSIPCKYVHIMEGLNLFIFFAKSFDVSEVCFV